MSRADRDAFETEALKFEVEIFVLGMIDLVHDQEHRALRSSQQARQFLVDRGQTLLRIDDERE